MPNRRTLKYLLIPLVLGFVAWQGYKTFPDAVGGPHQPLDAVLAAEAKTGWRLVRAPDADGPYRRDGMPTYVGRGEFGKVMYRGPDGPVTVKLEPKADVEQIAIPLHTPGGRITVVVLER